MLINLDRADARHQFARFAVTLVAAVALAGCSIPKHEATRPSTPNLIVILADDVGSEGFGCYGSESYRTPNVDRLAAEGARFANAFTQPLCTPTRVELLTGRSNARNYRAFSVLDPDERTFAEVLRANGYRTCAVGKWQLLAAEHYRKPIRGSGSTPNQAGFDRHALWQVEALGKRHWAPTLTIDGVTRKHGNEEYGPDLALDYAKRWIDEDPNRPFLLFWPMILPHGPFIPPPGSERAAGARSDPSQYRPMVEYVDTLVGRLCRHLEDHDLDRDTIVIFVGDNGSPRKIESVRDGSTVKGGKATPTDAGSRVPFVVWAPGRIEAGQVISDLVSTVDIFATLLDAADVPVPSDRSLDGWSFWPQLEGSSARHREWVTFHFHPRPVTRPKSKARRWARDERWQLFADGRLYDVARDPSLERPIAESEQDEEQATARRRLERALETLPLPVRVRGVNGSG